LTTRHRETGNTSATPDAPRVHRSHGPGSDSRGFRPHIGAPQWRDTPYPWGRTGATPSGRTVSGGPQRTPPPPAASRKSLHPVSGSCAPPRAVGVGCLWTPPRG